MVVTNEGIAYHLAFPVEIQTISEHPFADVEMMSVTASSSRITEADVPSSRMAKNFTIRYLGP